MEADKKESSAAPGMEAFFTRAVANQGIEVPLYLPDGTKSAHWVRIRGVDSDEFRAEEAESRRQVMDIAMMEDKAARASAVAESKLRLIASLVIAWSFPKPCTREAVVEFFREAPQIADAVDRVASRRSLFFAGRSSSSAPTQSTSSGST